MRVVSKAELEARRPLVAEVADAFGRRGGCYVRGYTDAELEQFVHAATRGGQLSGGRLQAVQLAQVLLRGPECASPRLLGDGPQPSRAEVERAAALPPGSRDRLTQISDELAGLTAERTARLRAGDSFLTEPAPREGFALVDVDQLVSRGFDVEFAEGLFGELGGIWVREYGAAERDAFERLGVRGQSVSVRRARWAKLAAVLVTGSEPDAPRLVGEDSVVRPADLEWIATYLWPGEQLVLERMADALAGWSADTEARLAGEVPLTGDSSASGPSSG